MGLCGSDPPDPSKGAAAGILADLQSLPWRRLVEAAAAEGTPTTINLPGRGGGPINLDFTGIGEGDYQRQYADQMAQQLLDLQNQFGPDYVQERLDELAQSDPEGQAMRQRLWQAVQSDVSQAQTAHRPAADELQQLIQAELDRGATLDDVTANRVSQAVRGGQVARGNYLGNAATTQEAQALGSAAEAAQAQRQQEALAFLTSGSTPEDVAYRRQEQALGNLGSFISGETPIAQFQQLAGAGGGVVPFTGTGQPLPGVNPNAAAQGIDWANSIYSANMNWNNSTVNPYLAGLAGGVRGVGVWAGLGGGTPTAAGPTGINPGGWAFTEA